MLCLQLPVGQMFLLLQGTCFLRGQLGCAAAIEHLPASHGLVVLGRTCLLTALQGWHMTQCKLQHVCSHSLLSFSLFNVNSFECAWAIFVSCTSPGRWDIRDDCAAVWAVFFQKPWTKAVDDLVWLHRDVGRPCNKLFLQFRCLSERNGCGGQLWLLWFLGHSASTAWVLLHLSHCLGLLLTCRCKVLDRGSSWKKLTSIFCLF